MLRQRVYLRPSRIDEAKHAAAILQLWVKRLRQQWPQVRIVLRGDSGFCRQRNFNLCDRVAVSCIAGPARTARLQSSIEFVELAMEEAFEQTGTKQREVGEFEHAAQSWSRERQVITRLEYGEQRNNPGYVGTNLKGDVQAWYDDRYCQFSEAENRIKAVQVGQFATGMGCQWFQRDRLRMLLAALGYVLIERLPALKLKGTKLATAQVDALRIKLLKFAGVVTRNARNVRLHLASNWPRADPVSACHAAIALTASPHRAPGPRVDKNMARNPRRHVSARSHPGIRSHHEQLAPLGAARSTRHHRLPARRRQSTRQKFQHALDSQHGCRVQRFLSRGGVFMYPWDQREPNKPGKLRLMYEANPMSWLIEQAGGASTNGRTRIIGITPMQLHECGSVILGSKNQVDRITATTKTPAAPPMALSASYNQSSPM